MGSIETRPKDDKLHEADIERIKEGHLVSLAVNKEYRCCGVASALIMQLHKSFLEMYDVEAMTLYCRTSNTAAIKLYADVFHYKCFDTIEDYYEDGESACYMKLLCK